jgi:hypothetical protein
MALRPHNISHDSRYRSSTKRGDADRRAQAQQEFGGGRVYRMRATLRKNGYDVAANGPITHRMLRAWHDYRTGGHPASVERIQQG